MYDQSSCHIESNQLIYCANQLTGFHMTGAFVLNELIYAIAGLIQINYAKIQINISVIKSIAWVTPRLVLSGLNRLNWINWTDDGGPYHIETSPLICYASQWIGVYMIRTSSWKS